MLFVVSHFPDVPVSVWINKRVFLLRIFVTLHERHAIPFNITAVAALAARPPVLYAARATAKSFPEFAQFEAVTQTAF